MIDYLITHVIHKVLGKQFHVAVELADSKQFVKVEE